MRKQLVKIKKKSAKSDTVETMVLPVAGLGKRLRPLTLRLPKALVPLRGKPLIEYAIEETRGTDIKHVVIVASPNHREPLEKYLREKKRTFYHLEFSLKIQETPAGNGHAILQAADVLWGSPFAVRFCDDVLFTEPSPLKALTDIYTVYQESVVLLERVPHERVSSYGIVKAKKVRQNPLLKEDHIYDIQGVIEKPTPHDAPSDLAIVGGYVFHPRILEYLQTIEKSLTKLTNDVLLVTDAFTENLVSGHQIFGWEFNGKRFDCGTLDGLKYAEDILSRRKAMVRRVEH